MTWQRYWAGKTHGQHAFKDEIFLARKANAQLALLGPGKSLLDFGCGAAELLVHMAPHYKYIIGADFSSSMLSMAQKRATSYKLTNIDWIEADDVTIWNNPIIKEGKGQVRTFDHITCAEVVQYLTPKQIERFLDNALSHINPGGRLLLSGCIEPLLLQKWRKGAFVPSWQKGIYFLKNFARQAVIIYRKINKFEHVDPNGNAYPEEFMWQLAAKHGLNMEIYPSTIFEYRYDVLIKN